MLTSPRTDNGAVLKYNPQLDGLRFCAVFFVVCYHWLPSVTDVKGSYFFGGFINFFFVLSSYLITRILFSARMKADAMGASRFTAMGVFLLRRTLRIFPAFYVFLLIAMMVPKAGIVIRENAATYFSYLSNYQVFFDQEWPTITSHIWTLAIEEQFYLLWPFVILFLPQRHMLKTLVFLIPASIILKALLYQPAPIVPQDILTHFSLEPFAIGGLLAYKIKFATPEENRLIDTWTTRFIWIGVVVLVVEAYYYEFIFNREVYSLISFKIIEGAIRKYKGFLGRFLENKTVVHLGNMSYGIYLYHLLIPVVFWKGYYFVFDKVRVLFPEFYQAQALTIEKFSKFLGSELACFVIYASLSILVATISWRLIEQPINSLKGLFRFDRPANAVTLTTKKVAS